MQLLNVLRPFNLPIAQIELAVGGIHLPRGIFILRNQCVNAIHRRKVQRFQNGAGVCQKAVLLRTGGLGAKIRLAALLTDAFDAAVFQAGRRVFFQQSVYDPAADLFLGGIKDRTIQQQIRVCVLQLPKRLHGVQFLRGHGGEFFKARLVGQVVHHAVKESQHFAFLR